jgi:probable lipoprotein NlpC
MSREFKNFISQAVGVPFQDRGRDFNGWDCWGLVWKAYREALGFNLPCLEDVPALKNWQAGNLFRAISQQHQEVPVGKENPGDVAVFRGYPVHIGLVVAPGKMLHVEPGIATCVESFLAPPWIQRILGIYRHVQLAGAY